MQLLTILYTSSFQYVWRGCEMSLLACVVALAAWFPARRQGMTLCPCPTRQPRRGKPLRYGGDVLLVESDIHRGVHGILP